jgi:FAD/FMN-containing dehydrogenase
MNRRVVMRAIGMLPFLSAGFAALFAQAKDAQAMATRPRQRVRPADHDWPKSEDWDRLNQAVDGRLLRVHSPLIECRHAPTSADCAQVFTALQNPYYIGDEPGLAQTLGWVDAWTFAPSIYAVAAKRTGDIVAAINFARQKNLRVVIKGGGHSYQGTSNAADSLLIWTRHMNAITVHEAFVPRGCETSSPKQAVSVGAGAIWMQVYDVVTTQHGRYVQGGGCTTVGVAGLVQSGGFGSFSKRYGSAASSLLEAEIVTADGDVRIANACTNSDLFWGIKGGGGGSLGVVTRVTLETHELPALFGVVNADIQASSDAAFRKLIGKVLTFYREQLLNPHWGEQIVFKANRVLTIRMVSEGLDRGAATGIWSSFFDEITRVPEEFSFISKPSIMDFPARRLWDPEFLKRIPGVTKSDDRAGADPRDIFWAGDGAQCGQVLHGFDSIWLPAGLLDDTHLQRFADALYAAAKQWEVSLHVNKGLAGGPPEAIQAARNTATNPAVLDAFALAIIAAQEPPAYPGVPGHEPNLAEARADAAGIQRAMAELRRQVPQSGSYVSESNFFEKQWQRAFWGVNYARLLEVKTKYDPEGLFYAYHGVGSEAWSLDGFTRRG